MKTIGEIIKEKRKDLELTQKNLANIIGVRRTAIGRWETGECYPNVLNLCDLADVLGCTTDELLGRNI